MKKGEHDSQEASQHTKQDSSEGSSSDPSHPEADATKKCEEEKLQLKDQLLRTLADLENLRKRAEREREDALKYGITKFAKDCLAVLDTFQCALSLPKDAPSTAIVEGLQLAEKEFVATLKRHGVEPVSTQKGDAFDPAYHEAMFEVETAEHPAGRVVEVLQIGYTLQGRLLRPSLTGVSARPKTNTASHAEESVIEASRKVGKE